MSRIRIVTDSAAHFPHPNFIQRYPITIVPMTIHCSDGMLEDHPKNQATIMEQYFLDSHSPPYAEAPSVERIAQVYRRLQRETDQILSIHMSSRLSETAANARRASQMFLGRCDIQVIDSETISVGLGLLVQSAAEAALRGTDLEEIVRITRGMIPRIYMIFFLEDLTYLEQNGLISRSQAILGNMLGIIPFLTMEEGRIIPMEKVRSRPRAYEKLIEFVTEFAAIEQLVVLQSPFHSVNEGHMVAERLQAIYQQTPITITNYIPSVATFVGPKSLGIVVLEAAEEG